jgi:hypothetical protein
MNIPMCPGCKEECNISVEQKDDDKGDSWFKIYMICHRCEVNGSVVLSGYNIDENYFEIVKTRDS